MAGKEDRRVTMTKRMLKDSLLELLKTSGIHEIAIRTLCKHADVNRSTFYKYYGSQYDLLAEMESDFIQRIEDSIHDVDVAQIPFQDILQFIEENIELGRQLVNSNTDPDFAQKLFNLPSVKRLIYDNLPVKEQDYAAEYFHACYVDGFYSVIKHWMNKEDRESPKEMARIMLHVLTKRSGIPFPDNP